MIIVKLGGSAVTDKSKDFTPRLEVIENAVSQLSDITDPLVLVHGGGSYGHPLAKEYSLHKGFSDTRQLSGVSQTRYSMTQLNQIILSILLRHGVNAVSVQPSACFVCSSKRISRAFLAPVTGLLALGCTPVLYGDVVTDLEMGFCILSGDQIVSYLAGALNPRKVIFGLEVDGLYTEDPRNEGARLVKDITFADLESISAGEVGDVTSGMKGKLQEISRISEIEVDLINLTRETTLIKAVSGEVDGTRIH